MGSVRKCKVFSQADVKVVCRTERIKYRQNEFFVLNQIFQKFLAKNDNTDKTLSSNSLSEENRLHKTCSETLMKKVWFRNLKQHVG